MNGFYFLLPFLLVAGIGTWHDSFALEVITGYNYFDVKNPDGTRTWTNHEPYVFDGNNWVPYIQTGNTIHTDLASVTLNDDGSFVWDGKFTDTIIAKYSDVTDQVIWTYPNTLNNDTPDISWDGSAFVSSKVKAGIGQLDYKYILNNGKWKTHLEATNLSPLNTKVFGFDQIIDLQSDSIKFNGVTRNLDNFNGTTFDKNWLDANKGKVIDLLTGVNFDFDLGYENLYSVTVYDTGVNSSRLVFDYRTNEILLPGQTLIIDPTFGYATGNMYNAYLAANAATTCATTGLQINGNELTPVYRPSSGVSDNCRVSAFEVDISSIPDTTTIVSSVRFKYDVDTEVGDIGTCKFTSVTGTQPSSRASNPANALALFSDVFSSPTTYVANATCNTVANDYTYDLGGSAAADVLSQLIDDWFVVGISASSMTRDATTSYFQNNPTTDFELEIVYSEVPPPDRINDLTYANLSTNSLDLLWTQPALNGGNLTNYLINYTTPWGNPQTFLANTTNTYYNVTSLTFGSDYSFRVSALTEAGYNATGNILNVTTTSTTYVTPPVLTAFGPSSALTQINLEFPSSTMQNINGYRIQRETPITTGWVTIVSNTTNTNTFYNNTGLTANIIYNYRVYALNGTGISTASNTYAMTTFHLPDAVTTLTGTPTDLSTIDLSWTAPTSYAPAILGYMINGTTPTGDPVDVLNSNTGTAATTATALNLLIGQEYSFRVAPITVHGLNASGNIWNGSTVQTFVIGNLSSPDVTNDDDFSIFFDRTDLNSSAIQLDVTYPNSYNLSCDFSYKYARINQTYSGLTTVPNGTDNQVATFTLINATGDLVQVRCWDVLTGDESKYVITITDFPFLQQIQSLRNGDYGTFFQIGAFDGVMLIIIFLGMVGLNRTTPIVGIVFVVITTLVMSYFELITYPVIMYPALIMMIVWAFVTTRKDD